MLLGALGDESETTNVTVVALPNGNNTTVADSIRAGLEAASGRLAMPETTASGYGDGMANAPRSDWLPRRIGPTFSEHEVTLHMHVTAEVLGAAGIPPAMFDSKMSAGAGKEAYRQFLLGGVQPVASLIAEEAGRVLETDVAMEFHELAAADLVQRSRSFKALTDAGIKAMELVGW